MDITGKPSRSQYSGSLKDTICTICGKSLNNMNRIEQDKHGKKCKEQTRLM